jgi:taurine--2-oxoglutarate transaminase
MHRVDEAMRMSEAEIQELTRKHVLMPWAVQGKCDPLVIARGEGCHFWDAKGKKYLDFWSQATVTNAGLNNKTIIEAMKTQLDILPYVTEGATTGVKAEYCRLVAELAPHNLTKTYILTSGADAVDHAIRIAKVYTGRSKIISRYRPYHGATYGAITLTGDARRPRVEPGIPGVVRAFLPYCYRCPFGHEYPACGIQCAENVRDIICYENPDTVAAMIVETITGSNGIIIPPPEYYPRLVGILKEFGVLLICDEILVAWGRTGKWFACEHWNLKPEILTCAKGTASGYFPLALVLISEAISDYLDDKLLYVGSTFSGHPLGAAAGIGAITAYREGGMVENSARLGKVLMRRLDAMKERHPCVGDVRGLGLCAMLELVKDKKTKEALIPWHTRDFLNTEGIMTILKNEMLQRGLLTAVRRNLIGIEPPLCITEGELMSGLEIVDDVLYIADASLKT